MRAVFGLAGLLVALGVLGVLVKQQLAKTQQSVPALQQHLPLNPASAASAAVGTFKEQGQQVQQQYQQALDAALAPRAMPDDK